MEQSDRSFQEQRKNKRVLSSVTVLYSVRIPFPVRMRIGDSDCSAVAQDIGEGGMGLLTNRYLPVECLLGLRFTILNDFASKKEDQSHTFELDALVRNCLRVEETNYRLGVCFVSISEPDRAYIASYVKSNALTPNPNA